MTTLTRQEQIDTLGKKICLLLQEKYGTFFSSSYEGAGMVATLKIVSSDLKKIKWAKSYLKSSLKLGMKKVSKNHGSGIHTTILIDLSDVSADSAERILSATQPVLKKANDNKKEVLPVVGTEKLEHVSESVPEPEAAAIIILEEVVKIEKDHDLKSLISYITWMLKFEGVSSKSFLCDKMKEGEYCITCNSTDDAVKVDTYLSWLVGDPSLVVTEKKVVMVDYKKKIKKEKSLERFRFCLPPSGRADSEEIKRRLLRVSVGSRPSVSARSESKFMVSYVRSNFAEKVYSVLISMGWKVEALSKSSFIVSVVNPEELVSSVPEVQTLPDNNEVQVSSSSDLPVSQNRSDLLFGIKTKEEALIEIMKLYDDSVLFNGLSPETQQRIIAVVKEEARKNNPEQFAQNLLSIIGK